MASQPDRKRGYLLLSVCVNLGLLCAFKYADFLLDNFSWIVRDLELGEWHPQPFGFVIPLGISFYTFQTMSYTIDVYRGRVQPMDSLLEFGTYVTFFPQLVAGPIVRASEFAPQITTPRSVSEEQVCWGLTRIAVGLIKKVIVADWLAAIVEPAFQDPASYHGTAMLFAVYAYSIQIYCDFSGYCDIALGCAALLGFRLPENFRSPYLARSIPEFWRRWHITLSSWLRDYLYISLGGNRLGRWRTYCNLMLTMLLGGLWHGASWNFVIWGGIHGAILVAHRAYLAVRGDVAERSSRPGDLLRVLLTYNIVCFAWVFFRCETLDGSLAVIRTVSGGLLTAQGALVGIATSPLILGVYWLGHRAREWTLAFSPTLAWQRAAFGAALGAAAWALSVIAAPSAEFIYFQF